MKITDLVVMFCFAVVDIKKNKINKRFQQQQQNLEIKSTLDSGENTTVSAAILCQAVYNSDVTNRAGR